jgi:hypothetical protein
MADDKKVVEQEQLQLQQNIQVGKELEKILNSGVWKKTIKPMIDRGIGDNFGAPIGNYWSVGLNAAIKDLDVSKLLWYVGYKQALIDLNNMLYRIVEQVKPCEEKLQALSKPPEDTMPLVDGPYGEEKPKI